MSDSKILDWFRKNFTIRTLTSLTLPIVPTIAITQQVSAQTLEERITSTVIVEGKIFKVNRSSVTDLQGHKISDPYFTQRAIYTRDIAHDLFNISNPQLEIKGLTSISLLEFSSKWDTAQDFVMGHTSEIEAGLNMPVKLLEYLLFGGSTEISDAIDFSVSAFNDELKEIKEDPSIYFKKVAEKLHRESTKRKKFLSESAKQLRNGEMLTHNKALKIKQAADFIQIYSNNSLNLYRDVLNADPLEQRWMREFAETALSNLTYFPEVISNKELNEILGVSRIRLEQSEAFKEFQSRIKKKKEEIEKKRKKKRKELIREARETTRPLEELIKEGSIFIRIGNFKEAKTYYTNLARTYPDNTEIEFNLALAHVGLNENSTAINLLHRVINKKPNKFKPHKILGILYLGEKRFDDARKEFERALELNPNDKESYEFMRDFLPDYKEKEVDSHIKKAIKLTNQGNLDEAIKEYEIAYNLDKNNDLPLARIGALYFSKNQCNKAIEYCNSALNINPNNLETITTLIYSKIACGELEEALKLSGNILREDLIDGSLSVRNIQLSQDYTYLAGGLINKKMKEGRNVDDQMIRDYIKIGGDQLRSWLAYHKKYKVPPMAEEKFKKVLWDFQEISEKVTGTRWREPRNRY